MLIPLPEPKNDDHLLHGEEYRGHGVHPFTLFERCNHELCGEPAVIYLVYVRDKYHQWLFSRCEQCLKTRSLPSSLTPKYVTREEAVGLIAIHKVMNS